MAKKRKRRPEYPAEVILPNGKRMQLTIFAVRSRWSCGTPKDLVLLLPDTNVKLSENPEENQFIVGYVSKPLNNPEGSNERG